MEGLYRFGNSEEGPRRASRVTLPSGRGGSSLRRPIIALAPFGCQPAQASGRARACR